MDLILQLLLQVNLLHLGGLVHQNLHPESVLLDQIGNLYLTDPGLIAPSYYNVKDLSSIFTFQPNQFSLDFSPLIKFRDHRLTNVISLRRQSGEPPDLFGVRVDCIQAGMLVYYIATDGELLFTYEQRMSIIKNKEKNYLERRLEQLDPLYKELIVALI